ncbi:type IV pilus assembly protein PilA [Nitrosovibrio sp. Nv6]|nr:type IV pilus assembly protein PilA [Nitrosovibrio sp. Nv6]
MDSMSFNQKTFIGMVRDQWGLTLIEMMMIFAIIGILVTIAIPPAYQLYEDSQAREQVTEAMNLLDSVKAPVAGFYSDKGRWPTETEFDSLVTTKTGKYVASLTPRILPNGFQVTATFRNKGVSPGLLNEGTGRTLVLATKNGVEWVCNDNTDSANGVPGLIAGSVLPQHRPQSCK